ncbi:peptidoglycan-recognition protein SC2-like [Ceratitis capitata]|uniref:peptidoglycan-recognition protein SC2-like n=1 Tax=Ceratitis capitata TaxID=7213 RepID=UPI000329F071|nr:peptidoglycan-recognition protein SC2-like [Ceratitis capitata]
MSYNSPFLLLTVGVLCLHTVVGVNIISRAQWGARAPTSTSYLSNGLSIAVIHHTASAYCSTQADCSQQVRNIQKYHMDSSGWDDIGYNFLIGGDGQVYEGRGWNIVGAHVTNRNSKSIGISFIGNYNNNRPTAAQINAAKALLATAVSKGQLKSDYALYGHRHFKATECPGNNLYNEIKTWPRFKV